MSGIFNGPPRGGTRGGKDQFNWDNVKSDKDREFYLGHSLKATTGRWQKGKDVFWYTRNKDAASSQAHDREVALVKQKEEELMMEALGLKPKSSPLVSQAPLDKADMHRLLENDEGGTVEYGDTTRMTGLGFNKGGGGGRVPEQFVEMHETLIGTRMPRQGNDGNTVLGGVEKEGRKVPSKSVSAREKSEREHKKKTEKKERKDKKSKKRKHSRNESDSDIVKEGGGGLKRRR